MAEVAATGSVYWVCFVILALSFTGMIAGLTGLWRPRTFGGTLTGLGGIAILTMLAVLEVARSVEITQRDLRGLQHCFVQFSLMAGALCVGLGAHRLVSAHEFLSQVFSRRLALSLLVISSGGIALVLITVEPPCLILPDIPRPPALLREPGLQLYSDAGNPIQGYTTETTRSSLDVREAQLLTEFYQSGAVFRVSAPDPRCNCHGWVFLGGRGHLIGKVVEQILRDNGYRPTTTPRPGDLIIYRDSGRVMHTGQVKAIGNDGFVLVESKWGIEGRYLHQPEVAQEYGPDLTYYHSARQGHLLRGCESDSKQLFSREANTAVRVEPGS